MNPASPIQILKPQRPADPPILWLSVLAGSILIHLFLFLAIRGALLRVVQIELAAAPITFEMVEPSPASAPSTPDSIDTADATAQTTASKTAPASTPESSPAVPPQPAPDPAGDRPPVSPEDSPAQAPPRPVVAPPIRPTAPTSPPSPSPSPPVSPSPRLPVSPSPSPVSPSPPDTGTPPPPSPDSTTSRTDGEESGSQLPDLPTGIPTPAPDNNTGEAGGGSEDSTFTQVPVSSVPEATSFSASITRTSLPADVPDRPEVLAALVPGETSKTFESDVSGSGCLITPESLRNFGQPVTARITVDNTGNVIGVDRPLLTPSGNPSYDELATCAIKTWKFSPAYNKKDGEKSYVFSNLDVEITITSAVK